MTYDLLFKEDVNNKSPINLIFGSNTDSPEEEAGIQLLFKDPLNNKNPINLIFGGESDEPNPPQQVHKISGVIPLYDFSLFGSLSVDYGINPNLVYQQHKAIYKEAIKLYGSYLLSFNESAKIIKYSSLMYKEAYKVLWAFSTFWGSYSKQANTAQAFWKTAVKVIGLPSESYWLNSDKYSGNSSNNWNEAVVVYRNNGTDWGNGAALDYYGRALFEDAQQLTSFKFIVNWGKGLSQSTHGNLIWGFASLPGGCGPSVRPPYKPPYIPDDGSKTVTIDLVFCKAPNNKNPIDLIFGDECGKEENQHTIDDKKVYIVKNDIKIFRTDSGNFIRAFSVEIGANRQDYLWSGALSLPYSDLEKIADKPEIEININQYKFIVDVNEINIKKVFNSRIIELSVFSTTQRLNTIKAHKIGIDMSSNAIMSAQLHRDDLVTGFEFVNSDVDWIVPANLIEYDEANALDIISQFGVATNDTVVSHAYEKKMVMKPKYPMGEPIYSLPSSKLFDFNESEIKGSEFNAIVVSGENVGVTAVIRKDGSAGEKIAPMIINKLITAEEAARRTGFNSIYNTADISSTIDVAAPLYPEAPQLYPSDIVRIDNDVGWIDSVSISAKSDSGAITVRHSFTIEKKVV